MGWDGDEECIGVVESCQFEQFASAWSCGAGSQPNFPQCGLDLQDGVPVGMGKYVT